jgi:hypothetical protein
MISPTPATRLVSVYDGTHCLGHVLHRPKIGFEAYDRYDRSAGIFLTQREAADALAETERSGR